MMRILTMAKRFLKQISILFVIFLLGGILCLFLSPKPLLLGGLSYSKVIYDEGHNLLRLSLSKDDKYRVFTPLSKISPQLVAATLLQEDQYFYQHYGINPLALLKAMWQTYFVKSRRVGASTITMQVARLRYGIASKRWLGKLVQLVRAIQLEYYYSKKEILEAYLNLAPYGNNIEGVGGASLIYFNKDPRDLNLPEALTLSVIPQNPRKRLPNNKALKEIRNKVFLRWLNKHPEDAVYKMTMQLPLAMRSLEEMPLIAPHLVYNVLKEASAETLEISTTLDLHLQKIISGIVRHYINRKKNLGVYNASALLLDTRDMGIKAWVGSADFFDTTLSGQIDGTSIKRSPGSTLKPFIYGLAFEQGLIHPNTVLKDVPRSFGSYNPENFDYDFMGPVKAKDALVLSRNIPAIYLASQLRRPSLYDFLRQANIEFLHSESFYGLALVLGGAELTMQELVGLYAMLVNGGVWHPLRKRTSDEVSAGKPLLSPEASFLVLQSLKETPRPLSYGEGSHPISVAWKTGTSSGYRDAWSIGSFGPYVLAVWVGNFNNKGNPVFVGKEIAAPLFFELIDAIGKEKSSLPSVEIYPNQLHLAQIKVCKASGMLPTRYCQATEKTWFIPGKSPIQRDNIYREVAINKKTGLRTCRFDGDTRYEIFEFWPTDLLKIFKQAGIYPRLPPASDASCTLNLRREELSPQITSPQPEFYYIIPLHTKQVVSIPLVAIVDGGVRVIYWFINDSFIGKTTPEKTFLWKAKPGKYTVRVVDDQGLSDVIEFTVVVS